MKPSYPDATTAGSTFGLPSTSGYGPPPIPGQPIGGAYQPQYGSLPYHPSQGPPQSLYSSQPDLPPQTSHYPPPPTHPHPGYTAPPVPHPQQPPPLPNASTYPGAPHVSHAPPSWYLGTEVPNIFVLADFIVPGYNPAGDAEKIRNATKGFGTNDDVLISTLAPLSAMKMQAVANRFLAAYGLQLVDVLDKESRFNFNWCLRALAMGPLGWDVWLLREAMQGIGTKEKILTELLLARPMSEIRLLISAYQHFTGRQLIQDVQNDLSMKTKRMFLMALSSDRSPDTTPVDYAHVARDVDVLYNAGEKRFGTDEMVFCEIFINRSPAHLRAVFDAYPKKYKKYRSFAKVIRAEFRGHMEAALLHIYKGADPKHDQPSIYRDAKLIHQSMKGFGTRDHELIWRVVRAHWDHIRFEGIKAAYFKKQKTTLEYHIGKETSGSYRKLLLELTQSVGKVKR
ncbi:Annexin A11 [Termitomyces sp. J132]|nr:Annexin A11 [Termitomyces sp. J132]